MFKNKYLHQIVCGLLAELLRQLEHHALGQQKAAEQVEIAAHFLFVDMARSSSVLNKCLMSASSNTPEDMGFFLMNEVRS